jgi:hypothetical protein
MTYQVSVNTNRTFAIRANGQNKLKVQTSVGGVQVPARFSDLEDYNSSGVQDKYVLMYDAATQTYVPVNPDIVLSNAATESSSVGLPTSFVNQLDTQLDNKINFDGGVF